MQWWYASQYLNLKETIKTLSSLIYCFRKSIIIMIIITNIKYIKFWTYRKINTFSTISQLWLCMTTTFIIIYRLTFRNAFWYSIVRLKFVFKSLKSVFKSATTHWLEQKQSNIHDINYIKWSSKLPA